MTLRNVIIFFCWLGLSILSFIWMHGVSFAQFMDGATLPPLQYAFNLIILVTPLGLMCNCLFLIYQVYKGK